MLWIRVTEIEASIFGGLSPRMRVEANAAPTLFPTKLDLFHGSGRALKNVIAHRILSHAYPEHE